MVNNLEQHALQCAAQSGAVDPDLQLLLESWPILPDGVRKGIVALVRSVLPQS
jgi:hypothetical protein